MERRILSRRGDPRAQKVLPRAILIGTAVVMVLYLAVNVVYALALPAAAVRTW